MYHIMFRLHGSNCYKCLGSNTDSELALKEMDEMEKGLLGKMGDFKLVKKGNMRSCEECKAECTGAGKEGNGNQCSYYTTERKEA